MKITGHQVYVSQRIALIQGQNSVYDLTCEDTGWYQRRNVKAATAAKSVLIDKGRKISLKSFAQGFLRNRDRCGLEKVLYFNLLVSCLVVQISRSPVSYPELYPGLNLHVTLPKFGAEFWVGSRVDQNFFYLPGTWVELREESIERVRFGSRVGPKKVPDRFINHLPGTYSESGLICVFLSKFPESPRFCVLILKMMA